MIHALDDVRRGFDVECDAVVVGSGAGGAVAAANLARGGLRTVVLEAGPRVGPEDMTRNGPLFLARYFWEGGLRMVGGTGQFPSLQGRCLGGSTVMNSAIMLRLPDWVRGEWYADTGVELFRSPALDQAYDRVFARLRVAETPLTVMGRRNLLVRDALDAAGMKSGPLPRAVVDCDGCADCLTGCAGGRKQSADRTFLADAERDRAELYTCSQATRIEVERGRASGVTGDVVDPFTRERLASFRVRAKTVVVSAGAMQTPALLLASGITANRRVGATFFAHIGGGMVGIMDEVVDPWVGATQGWGALSSEIRGMKYECLWAPPSVLMVRWGDVGHAFLKRLGEVKHATVIALVYRGKVSGRVRVNRKGMPRAQLFIPDSEAYVVNRGLRTAAQALLKIGARYVHTGVPGAVEEMRTPEDTDSLLDRRIRAKHLQNTLTHVFGSCRMSARPDGVVDDTGKVRGLESLYLADASIFPSPSAVNPQATVMALSDVVSRRLADLA